MNTGNISQAAGIYTVMRHQLSFFFYPPQTGVLDEMWNLARFP